MSDFVSKANDPPLLSTVATEMTAENVYANAERACVGKIKS